MFNFFTNSDIPKLIISPSDYFMDFVRSSSFDRVDFLPIFCLLRLEKVVSLALFCPGIILVNFACSFLPSRAGQGKLLTCIISTGFEPI